MSFNTYKNLKNEINKHNNFVLSSSSGNIPATTETTYINERFELYCYLQKESSLVKQIQYNGKIESVIYSGSKSQNNGIRYKGIAEVITDYDQEKEIRDKFIDKYNYMKPFIKSEDSILIKLRPLEIQRIQSTKIDEAEALKFKENQQSIFSQILSGISNWFRKWSSALRISFISTTFGSILLGGALAYITNSNSFDNWLNFLIFILSAITAHGATNLLNDYHKSKFGQDNYKNIATPLTGGSLMIQKGLLAPIKLLSGAIFLFIVSLSGLVYLNFCLPGNWILLLGGVAILLAYFYSSPPFKLINLGIGELIFSIIFGVLTTTGTYFVLTSSFTWLPVLASVPLSIFVFLIIYIHELQELDPKNQDENKNLASKFSTKIVALKLYNYLIFLPFLWVIAFALLGPFSYYTIITVVLAPLAFRAVSNANKNYDKIYGLIQTNGLTIGIHILFSILLSVGFLLKDIISLF